MRIAITGASGLIGKALVPALQAAGHEVVRLVRNRTPGPGEALWAPERGELDPRALLGPSGQRLDAAIHLAGENVGDGRWSEARKQAILGSRVDGTRTLVRALLALEQRPDVLVSSSAVGFYGPRDDQLLDESSPAGTGFLADVCRAWEAETEPASAAGIRVVTMRTGVVLAADGGALARLLTPFKLGLGGKIGGGRQWMPWVSLDDVVRAYIAALENPGLRGPVNLTSPEPATQGDFAKTLGRVLHRPTFMPLPGFMVKTLFGEMGDAVILAGQRVIPERLLAAGFSFRFPSLEPALRHLLPS